MILGPASAGHYFILGQQYMDSFRPRTVYFGRNGYAPSQVTVDKGRAFVTSCAMTLGGFIASFTALRQFRVSGDEGAAVFHLKGIAASLVLHFPDQWRSDWSEHIQSLAPGLRLVLGGQLALAGVVAALAGYMAWRKTAIPVDGYLHIRGRRLLEGDAALRVAKAVAKAETEGKSEREDILIHPKIRLATSRVSRHGIVFGKVGGGKTTIFLPVLAEILAKRHKVIIFDIKGDFTSKFWVKGGAAAILAPWDRRSLIWDIARDCQSRQDAARFATYLIKDSKDPMWSAAARQLCVGFLVHLQMTRGESWGWKDLADLLATPEKELLAMMLEANPEAIRAVEQTGTTTTGILINLSAFLSVIYDLAEAWPHRISGRMFSVQQWIFDEDSPHRGILLGGNKEFGPLMTAFAGALVAQAAACVCSPRLADSQTRRLYFVLDEFPQLGKVDIEPLVAVGRSKGARVWIGLQDFGQLKKLYGADEAQAIAAMIGTLICAGAAPGETAKFIADMAGSREVERSSLSTSIQGGASAASTSHTWQRETIPVLSESQASGLGPVSGTREIRALMLNFGDDALVLRWPFDTRPNIAEAVELAEWTLPTLAKREQAQERAELEAMQFLEGEDLEEAERRLAYVRELANNRKHADSPPEFDSAAAKAWLLNINVDAERMPIVEGAEPAPEPPPGFTVDAPSPKTTQHKQGEDDESEGPIVEHLVESAGHVADAVEVAGAGSALLKLAELASSIRQRPGPTREEAPAPRRSR